MFSYLKSFSPYEKPVSIVLSSNSVSEHITLLTKPRTLSIMKVLPFLHLFVFCSTGLTAWDQKSHSAELLVQDGNVENKGKYILDVDAGVDDATAILYFLGAEKQIGDFRVIAITCANGNTDVDHAVINVLKTLKVVNRLDIPVYKGCNESLLGIGDRDFYFGEDGFGNFYYPDPPSPNIAKKKNAVNALISLVRKRPEEISLICLAPLTNIAMAIRMYPSFLKDVKDIFILGGAVAGHGSMRPGVEFNFFVDPEAVFIVFQSAEKLGKKLTLVPSETFFIKTALPMEWRKNVLGAIKSPAMELINKAENKSLSGDIWLSGDPVLAAISLNKSLITSGSRHPVKMETCGSYSRGAIFVDYENKSESSTVAIVEDVDVETYKALLLKYLRH